MVEGRKDLIVKGVSEGFLKRVRECAAEERRTIKAVVILALESYLERKEDKTNEE